MRQREQRLTVSTTGRVVSQELQRNEVDLTQKIAGDRTNKEHSHGRLKRKVAVKNQRKEDKNNNQRDKKNNSIAPTARRKHSLHRKLAGRNKTPPGTSQGTKNKNHPSSQRN
jgi:hypothetical protein